MQLLHSFDVCDAIIIDVDAIGKIMNDVIFPNAVMKVYLLYKTLDGNTRKMRILYLEKPTAAMHHKCRRLFPGDILHYVT